MTGGHGATAVCTVRHAALQHGKGLQSIVITRVMMQGEIMWKEIRYALRLLGKTPGFTALTMFVLAAGLGTAIYMYVLVRTLAYADLPYPDGDRIATVGEVVNGVEQGGNSIGWFDFQQFKAQQTRFELLAFMRRADGMLSGASRPSQIIAYRFSSGDIFELTSVPALHGRRLQAIDFADDATPVMVLSWQLWQSHFHGDEAIVGKVVRFDDEPVTIVGVMPKDFAFPDVAQAWLPLIRKGTVTPGSGPAGRLIGKLKADVSISEADVALKAIAAQLAQQFPESNANSSVKVWPLTQHEMNNSMGIIRLMIGAAAFILLLVILNAGNLLLARAAERQKEIAVRSALGAPRHRLVREMLWEALLLTVIGGGLGCFLASWALQWSAQQLQQMASSLPFWWQFRFDSEAVLLALLLAVVIALLIGLYPALRTSSGDLTKHLRDGTHGAQSAQLSKMNHVLVITEIAVSVALLIAALTLVASTRNIASADYGARTDGVLTAHIDLYKQQYDEPDNLIRFSEQLESRMQSTPGIAAVALSCHVPGNYGPIWSYQVEGVDVPDKHYPNATKVVVTDNYFSLYGIPLRNGRLFDSRDQKDTEQVVIVSRAFAEKNWPGQNPIGKRIDLDYRHTNETRNWFTVIGVVEKVVYSQPHSDVAMLPELYLSYRQTPNEDMMISLRTQGEPMAMARTLLSEVQRIDSDLPLQDVMSLTERHLRSVAGISFVAKLFLAFGGLGILLAGSGMYGVIARAVALRTQELGVRRALGASEDQVLAMLVRQGGLRFVVGGAFGLMLGLLMTQVVASELYKVETSMYGIALGVLLLVGALVMTATLLPARRAVNLSPAAALRYE